MEANGDRPKIQRECSAACVDNCGYIYIYRSWGIGNMMWVDEGELQLDPMMRLSFFKNASTMDKRYQEVGTSLSKTI